MSEIDGDTPDIAVAVRQELRSPLPERQGTGEMMGITDGNAEPGAGRGTGRHRIPAGAGAVAGPVIAWGTTPGDLWGRRYYIKIAGKNPHDIAGRQPAG